MKTTIFKIFSMALISLMLLSCQEQLDVVNKNEPTLDALGTESGVFALATGVYTNMFFLDGGFDNFDFMWITLANHEIMGDAIYIPWGNFGWRWVNQVSSITLDDGTVVTPPQEGDQAASLKSRNTRAEIDGNAFAHEWTSMYFVNNTANVLLSALNEGVEFTGDSESKQAALKAWAYWWKAYAYSRIGSMYVSGIINDDPNIPGSNYVTREALITEADRLFDLAEVEIEKADTSELEAVLTKVIPTSYLASTVPSADAWKRNINTMKARNILVNIKDADKTANDWATIGTLVNSGLQQGDFMFRFTNDGVNFLQSAWVPSRLLLGWHFVSERLIQDFKPGDARYTRNIDTLPKDGIQVNRSGRGIQYGTRYTFKDGELASTNYKQVYAYIGGSWAENTLMAAEVAINTGSIEAGLALIDQVRTAQSSGLDAVAGTGLNESEAREELRLERRIGLLLRGLAFYDARRWGVTDPVSEGGGRSGCVVLDALGNVNTNATFDYKYMDYWDIPANELEFNSPSDSNIPIVESPK